MARSSQLTSLGLLISGVLLMPACGEAPLAPGPGGTSTGQEFQPDATPAASITITDGDGFTRGLGEKAGALIEVIRPDDWNGDLVLLMHGRAPANDPVTLQHPLHWQTQPAIDDLLARGYGIALSSYRKNGQAVVEGTIDTRIAEATFINQFGSPARTYLWGWSMGGGIGQQLLQTSPARYAGLLSVCSDQVGGIAVTQYGLDARVLFDYYFPGALPWDIRTDEADLFTELLPAIQAAFVADPAGYTERITKMSSIDQLQLPLGDGSPPHLILTALGSLLFFGGGAADLVESTGGLPVGNLDRIYTSDALSPQELSDINEHVARYEADPPAEQALLRLEPTGRTKGTPILALHTDGDAVVPAWLPPLYEPIAAAAGNADSYVLRIVPGFGHCELTPDVQPDAFADIQIQAFDDLAAWVELGIKPAP
jgi:pimeloyl-ACP methyl ester carboxylesterase